MDDFSCFSWIYFLKKKSKVLITYNQWKTDVQAFCKQEIETEELSENYIEFLHSDSGGEYIVAQKTVHMFACFALNHPNPDNP